MSTPSPSSRSGCRETSVPPEFGDELSSQVAIDLRLRLSGFGGSFGATRRHIFSVMMESVVATTLSGAVGRLVSIGVGTLAGLIPAIVAMRVCIIDAIRA